jgi:hypothetical protein
MIPTAVVTKRTRFSIVEYVLLILPAADRLIFNSAQAVQDYLDIHHAGECVDWRVHG